MRKSLSIIFIVLMLSGCITERAIKPADAKRAAELNAELGLGYMKQGQYKRALSKLDKALEHDSENVKALHYKGELYRRLNDLDKAGEYFNQAMALAPNDQLLVNNYGVYLCNIGKYDEAVKIFNKPLRDPFYENKANLYENIGLCRLYQGQIKQAEAAFTQSLALNKNMATSLIELAQIRFDLGDTTGAHEYYSRYLAVEKRHTPQSLWLGILLETKRGAKNAVASYKVKLKGRFPDSKETKLLLKYEQQGKL
jgi:type IV pilus assembly protein PilF